MVSEGVCNAASRACVRREQGFRSEATLMETTVANTIQRRWLTIEQAASYVNARPRTIRELIWRGELQRAKVGKRFLVDVSELDRLVASRMEREIDPNKPARISGRDRAEHLKTLYPCGSQRGAVDQQSTAPVVPK
jgi:excisionase family DNA binding protein